MVGCWLMVIAYAVSYMVAGDALDKAFPNYVFWLEALGLVSFGVSWLAASRTLPVITNPNERFRIADGSAPEDTGR